MGLTTDQVSDMAALSRLASNPGEASREEIYLAVTALYRVQGTYMNARERALAQDIVRTLSPNVSIRIRAALAERIADEVSAPPELILHLAGDAIEVARPVIARSALLTDADLLRLISQNGVAHHEVIASRPYLSESVCDALSEWGPHSVLVILAENLTARLSPALFETLFARSRLSSALYDRLTRRSDLPRTIAVALGQIAELRPDRESRPAENAPRFPASQHEHEPAESDNKLIEKLASSGQLRASFLMRVLSQGQIELFDAGLARLLGLSLTGLREHFYGGGPRAVALACRAAGIDRCVFQTIFALSRKAHGMVQPLGTNDMAEIDAAFRTSKPAALGLLQAA